MSDAKQQQRWVDDETCDRIRALKRDGLEYDDIAEIVGYHRTTVIRHCTGRCDHQGAQPTTDSTPSKEDIVVAIQRLSMALEPKRVPSTTDWNRWDKRVCSASHITDEFDSWRDAMTAAGLAPAASQAPKAARIAVYNDPTLTDGFSEVRG